MAKRKKKFNKKMILPLISIIVSTIFAIILLIVNILPIKFFAIILLIIVLFNLLFVILSKKGKKTVKIFNIIYILLYLIGTYYLIITYTTLNSFNSDKKVETYLVVALKENKYELSDLNKKTIGFYDDTNTSKVKEKISDAISYKDTDYKDESILKDLNNSNISAMVLEQAYYELITEDKDTSKYETIYKFDLESKLQSVVKEVNVTKDPFIVYISGIDTYGSIANVSRSDVNILLAVNPKTKQILLVNTPRDYRVILGDTGTYDKLTHAGVKGIESSIKTMENLYDIDINYYFKVNFSSVVDIVNALGGVNVYSEYAFTTHDGYKISQGNNNLNGKQALAFARTRKAFTEGDRVRGMNQMAVIKAMINKIVSPSMLTRYSSLLSSVSGRFQTNLSTENIAKLVKMQLNDMSDWNINSVSVTGTDSHEYGYYYPSTKLYMLLQDEKEVAKVQKYIEQLYNGKDLGDITEVVDSGVINITNTTKPVTKPVVVTKEEVTTEDSEITKEDPIVITSEEIEITSED